MQTTFPRLMLDHAKQRPAAPALREKVYGIWQTTSWAELAQLVRRIACGLHEAGMVRDDHVVVVGENRPRLYATMLAVQSLGAVPVPLYQDAATTEYVFPINNAEVRFAIVEDQEQVDKMIEVREQLPAAAAHLVRRPARPAQLQRTRAGGAGRADRGRPGLRRRARRLLRRRGGPRPAAGRGGDVLHHRHHRQPQGRGAHAFHAARPRRRRRPLRQARPQPRRCWPTCRRPGSARTSSAMRSGWPAATWSTAPSRPRR